jgi:class 3 adenylate cyclase
MLSTRGPAARFSVAALLLGGALEEILFLANPAQATALYYADELAAHADYLAGIGRLAMVPVALATATELATAVLGLFIVWRAWDRPSARVLALFLAFAGVGWPAGVGLTPDVITALEALAVPSAMAALLRFSVVFPQPLEARTGGWPPSWLRGVFEPLPLTAGAVGLTLFSALLLPLGLVALQLFMVLLLVVGAGLAMFNLRASYGRAATAERRRLLWLVTGFYAFFWVLLLAFPAGLVIYMLGSLFAQLPGAFVDITFQSLVNVGVLLLPAFIGVGIFYSGALDPRLAIRAASIYGALGLILLSLFVAVENVASSQLMSMLHLPDNLGGWVAGTAVAGGCGPLWRWVEARSDRVLDRLLPPAADGAGEEEVIVFADIFGYARIKAVDESAALTLTSVFHAAARRSVEHHRGRVVQTGDGAVMSFAGADAALDAMAELRNRFHVAAGALGLAPPEIQVGMHRGVVARGRNGDLVGDVAEVASSLEGVAGPGRVLLSAHVAASLVAPQRFGLVAVGTVALKQVRVPIHCFRCEFAASASPPAQVAGSA